MVESGPLTSYKTSVMCLPHLPSSAPGNHRTAFASDFVTLETYCQWNHSSICPFDAGLFHSVLKVYPRYSIQQNLFSFKGLNKPLYVYITFCFSAYLSDI